MTTLEKKVKGIVSYLTGFMVDDAGHSGWWILKGENLAISVKPQFPGRLCFRLISGDNKVGGAYYMEESPEITVAVDRTDKAIASDIERRLLPVARAYMESLSAWRAEKSAILNRQNGMAEMLKKIGNGSDMWQRYNTGNIKVGVPWGKWAATVDQQGKVKIECEVDFETSCEIIEMITKD